MKKFLTKKIIRNIFTVFVCASMVITPEEIFLSNELKVEAAAAEPNWYGGAYEAGVNIYAMSNWYGQCTWYVWGRAYELTGIKLPCRNDAKTWYSVASNNGYSVGLEPAENAIAVWSKGQYGHVAYVEEVSGDNVTISESNWINTTSNNQYSLSAGMKYYSGRTTLTRDKMKTRYGTLLGYIYLTGSNSDSTPVSANETWKITATDGVNVRSGAGTTHNKVGFYAYNTIIDIYEKATANGYTWGHTKDGWFVLDYAEQVASDLEAPYINAWISDLKNKEFTVSAEISDNVAVTDIKIAVWTETNGQDDIHWYSCIDSLSGNNFKAWFDLAGYNYAKDTYHIHIYVYDAAGNKSGFPLTASVAGISQENTTVDKNEQDQVNKTQQETINKDIQQDKDNNQKEETEDNSISSPVNKPGDENNNLDGEQDTNNEIDEDIKIESPSVEFMEKQITIENGEEDELEYEINEVNGVREDTLIWSSSDTSIVTVEGGHITAISVGTAEITVTTTTGESAKCIVNVVDSNAITSISLEQTKLSLYIGETEWLDYILEPEDADEELLICTSSNSKVATIKDGIITGNAVGNAVITIKYGTLKATCNVTVKAASIKLKKTSATIKAGKKVKIQATITPKGKLKYTSSNKKIATVNSKGVVKAKRKGKAVISIKANGITKKFKINVK